MSSKKLLMIALGAMLVSAQVVKADGCFPEGFGKQVAGIALTAYGLGSIISAFELRYEATFIDPQGKIFSIHSPCLLSPRLWWGALFVVVGVALARKGFMVPALAISPEMIRIN
jgi:hypothetical protein